MVMGQLATTVDVAVIGGGPGGYTAAIRAAQLGLETVLIEKGQLGGLCTNTGCIPSKALIHAAGLMHEAQNADAMGIDATIKTDFARMQAWSDGVVRNLRGGINTLCGMNGVEVIKGNAFFSSSEKIIVDTDEGPREIQFKKAIIATGTRPRAIPGLETDHASLIDSDDIFSLREIPRNLLISGGGYIAVEMACLFSKLGSAVTVVCRGPRLLKEMEPELTDILARNMAAQGIRIIYKASVSSVEGKTAKVKAEDGTMSVPFDKLLVAAGRDISLEGLGLEKTKVRWMEDGTIITDESCRTLDDNIFAVGDVTAGPKLAHKAFRQGKVAAEAIAGQKSAFDNRAIPMVVYSDPEIASVGLGEEEARKKGYSLIMGRMPFTASGRAKTLNHQEGFVKIIADEKGILLGVHIVGYCAGDMIAEASLAIEMAATLEDIVSTIHAHPTMPEAFMEASEDALHQAIHIFRKQEAGK